MSKSYLGWTHLLIVFALSPLLLFPRMEWMPFAFLVPFFWIVNRTREKRFLVPTPLTKLILPLLLMVGVSCWATFDIEFSLGKVVGTLLGIFLFFAILQWTDSSLRLVFALIIFGLSGLILALASLFFTEWKVRVPILSDLNTLLPARITEIQGISVVFNPNAVGGAMIQFVPFLGIMLLYLWLHIDSPSRGRLSLLAGTAVALGITSLILVLSQSRGAWVGFGCSVLFLLAIRYKWLRWVALGGLILLILITFWLDIRQMEPEQAVVSASEAIGIKARFEIWDRAIYGIQDFPFTGMGMNVFRRNVHLLYPVFLLPPDMDVASAHNQILQTALDLGIPGLVIYLAIWSAVGKMLFLILRYSTYIFHRYVALGLSGGLIATFVHLQVDSIPLGAKVGIFWWFIVVLVAILYNLNFNGLDLDKRKTVEILILWILISLTAIALIGDHPYISLIIGVSGSIYLGWISVPGQIQNPVEQEKAG